MRMNKKLILFLVAIVVAYNGFAQKNIYNKYNGNFELGNISNWRAVEVVNGVVRHIENEDTSSSVEITDDSNSGRYAAEFTWGVSPAISDIVFDLKTPVTVGEKYIYRVSAKVASGSCRLRVYATYYDVNNKVLGDFNESSWVLTNEYTQHEWAIPSVAPPGTSFAVIGVRAINANGTRWPDSAVTTIIDDAQLWEGSVGEEYTLITSLTGTGDGSVSLSPSGGTYASGTEVTITANAYYQSEFVSWGGDASGTTNPIVITMDGNKNISATINSQVFSCVEMTNDSKEGANAVKFTWRTDESIDDIVFEISPEILPNANYIFKASAKSKSGPCLLVMHADFYDAGNTLISSSNDDFWQLTDTYAQHEWALPTSPENTSYVTVGFRVYNADGSRWPDTDIVTVIDEVQLWGSSPLSVDDQEINELFGLKAFPNPISSGTTLNYHLEKNSFVNVSIFNSFGRLVETLVNEEQPFGSRTMNWDGGNLPGGVYYVRLNVLNGNTQVIKVLINN